MMRILWISSLAWHNQEYEHPVAGPGAVSGSLFQQQVITGLRNLGCSVDVVCDYPYAKKANRTTKETSSHGCSFITIPSAKSSIIERLLKGFWIERAVRKQINKGKYDFAIAYLIHTPYLRGLKKAKIQGAKTILICPDLPDMMDMSLKDKPIKRFLKKIDMSIQNYLYKYVDGFVLFTSYMAEKLPIKDRPTAVIEGVASFEDLDSSMVGKELAIMHAGTLHKNIGIENIIDGFNLVPDSKVKLWIFGDGELKHYIQDAEAKNSNIHYFGFVDRSELFDYEKRASALINARNPDDEYTKYSFPSKTFEYLYSETPFITTWLKGMPEEYRDYLYVIKDNKPTTIAKVIREVEEKRLPPGLGRRAKAFVVENKNSICQSKRLYDFLNSVMQHHEEKQ